MELVKGGMLPRLTELNLAYGQLRPEHGQALGEAILAGACEALEVLRLFYNVGLTDAGLVPILENIESGGCKRIKVL